MITATEKPPLKPDLKSLLDARLALCTERKIWPNARNLLYGAKDLLKIDKHEEASDKVRVNIEFEKNVFGHNFKMKLHTYGQFHENEELEIILDSKTVFKGINFHPNTHNGVMQCVRLDSKDPGIHVEHYLPGDLCHSAEWDFWLDAEKIRVEIARMRAEAEAVVVQKQVVELETRPYSPQEKEIARNFGLEAVIK